VKLIDEIMEMGRLIDPHINRRPRFELKYDPSEGWSAKVTCASGYIDGRGDTDDAAVASLHAQCVAYTEKLNTWAGRLLARFAPSPLKPAKGEYRDG
jgi:hypothetical protein